MNVKRTILFLRAILLMCFILFLYPVSQTEAQQGPRFILDFTPQINWFQSNQPSQVRTKGYTFGYDLGLQLDYFTRKNFAFLTGIKIFHAGGKLSYVDTTTLMISDSGLVVPGNTPITYANEYVHIPLGIHLRSVEIGYFSFYFETGLSLLFRFNTWVNVDGYTDIKENGDKDVNMLNMAYFARLGVQYSLGGTTALTGGVAYTHGLLDMSKDTEDKPNDRLIFHSLGLRLGIVF